MEHSYVLSIVVSLFYFNQWSHFKSLQNRIALTSSLLKVKLNIWVYKNSMGPTSSPTFPSQAAHLPRTTKNSQQPFL